MTTTDFDTLFAYSDNCREQLQDELSRHETLFAEPFATTSPYDSTRKLLAHCIGAEERIMLVRLQNIFSITKLITERKWSLGYSKAASNRRILITCF